MSALIAAAWGRVSALAAGLFAALALLAAAWAAGRRDGWRASQAEALRRAARTREIRDAVESDVDRAGDAAGELRRDWRRR